MAHCSRRNEKSRPRLLPGNITLQNPFSRAFFLILKTNRYPMPLKTPDFWNKKSVVSYLLIPVSWLYRLGSRISRAFKRPYKASIPVLCIGGVVAGGSGKTPTVHAVVDLIRENGTYQNPVILTRGYGGILKGPTLVDPDIHDYSDVGDEALLHAAHAPTIVSADRAAGVRLAELSGADIIIMDDGLQNRTLAKTWAYLVIDAKQGIGNGHILPAGPLRESLRSALSRCVGVIYTNGTAAHHGDKPCFPTRLTVTSVPDGTRDYFAFTGLGYPEKFRTTLQENGMRLSGFQAFPDHHPYTAEDIEDVLRQADGAQLITTEKDFVRIPPQFRHRVEVLPVVLTFDDADAFLQSWKTA
ncbi:MAG: tetraacyldisaccharide 4'-kinase [Micavibrio aeruginosavorus]|uniref:Tetraacyldisaccharide 4'-kinase n=1 Tax=Micavibrio aeruginosavorus TaxID=349221 RepID=A0A2W5BKY2_9BACT|nr:MAG: tetraacyldisaccharide 4'-kinase [Micavibrio aeruginosavorus]